MSDKEIIEKSTIIKGNFNISLKIIGTQNSNYTINEFDVMEMHISPLHPTIPEYTFFSSIHRTFLKIDHIAEYKGCLKYIKREII